jgi:hypothetical protein
MLSRVEDAITRAGQRMDLSTAIYPGVMSPGGHANLREFRQDAFPTFIYGDASLTLLDRARTHASGTWHVAALSFDGKTMTHYVDGVRDVSGEVAFKVLGPGRMSIGVRQNLVSWFKGRIRQIHITPEALPPSRLLRLDKRGSD